MTSVIGACTLSLAAVAIAAPLRVHVGPVTCRAGAASLPVTASGIPAGTTRLGVTVRLGSSHALVGRAARAGSRRGTVTMRVPLDATALSSCGVPVGDALEVRLAARVPHRAVRVVRARVEGPDAPPAREAPAEPGEDPVHAPGPTPPPPQAPPIPAPALPGTTRAVFGTVGAPITEASGLAWSRSAGGLLWTHNDSGDSARVFAMGWDGALRATLPLAGVSAHDIEDIALGTGPGGTEALFVADIGDNAAVRAGVRIYRVAEPLVWGLPLGTMLTAASPHVIRLSYPDGARDAEALVADRTTGDLYVVTKREARSRVYRVSAAQVAAGSGVMHLVGEMPYGGVVGADACADGTTVVVKTYDGVRVHESAGGIGAALMGEGSARPYVREPQGEAIAVDPACEGYATLSEGTGQPIVRYAP